MTMPSTPEQDDEMRSLEAAILGHWDAKRDTAAIAELLAMEEGDVASILGRLLEERREVREPSRFVRSPRRGTILRRGWWFTRAA